MNEMERKQTIKRVGCLYRVSTKKQANVEDDIPMQRNACAEYIHKKEGWELTREYIEPGVSGYHKGLNERKVLQEVIKDVGDRKIDVLLVFMFDRIGRKDNETPFLLKRIVECGVEVWSVCEGQQTFENSADNLMNIIRFWGAGTESRKTAARVDSGRNYATKKGRFTGGVVAYGYRLVPTAKLDSKNRMINAFTKDPFESSVVEDIYTRLIDDNMSLNEIAVYLNENRHLRTRRGNQWSPSTIRNILKNPLYKGYMSYGKTRMQEVAGTQSDEITKEAFLDVKKRQRAVPAGQWILAKEANPDYVIVSEKRWQMAQEILARRYKKYTDTMQSAADRTWKSSLLLVGLLECGYCHGKLSPALSSQKIQRVDGSLSRSHTEFYKCNTRGRDKRLCPAKSYISRFQLEKAVLEVLDLFWDQIEWLDCPEEAVHYNTLLTKEFQVEKDRLAFLRKEHKKAHENVRKFKDEMYKAILGESDFDGKYINECLQTAEGKEKAIRKERDILQKHIEARTSAADGYIQTGERLPVWREVFAGAPLNIRKKLLSLLIGNIVVTENEIDIYCKINRDSFFNPARRENGREAMGGKEE